jgi:hypothetical protein
MEKITQLSPSRKWTPRSIREFHYTNAYCKRLKYTITGTDAQYVKISCDGTQFEYRTDLVEPLKPRVLVFNLKVHAQGDGINGKTHTQLFPSTITIDGCAKDKINKVTHTWNVK